MGGKGGEPDGDLAAAITRDFGSFTKLQEDFDKAATRVFGSGWAMVLVDPDGKLALVSRPNQDSPLMDGKKVLFGNDVWEHAQGNRVKKFSTNRLSAESVEIH
jgi:superoxide dismutase, Fe-Mn family